MTPTMRHDTGAAALGAALGGLLCVLVLTQVIVAATDVAATIQRARVAADAAALALIGESPTARLPEWLRDAAPPTPTRPPAHPVASVPPTHVDAPSAAAAALAAEVARANGAELLHIETSSWPQRVTVVVQAVPSAFTAWLWSGTRRQATATVGVDWSDPP